MQYRTNNYKKWQKKKKQKPQLEIMEVGLTPDLVVQRYCKLEKRLE